MSENLVISEATSQKKISENQFSTVLSPSLKEMMEVYQIRAGLEEIAGLTSAAFLEGDTADLQRELDAMLAAVRSDDLDAYAEHESSFIGSFWKRLTTASSVGSGTL